MSPHAWLSLLHAAVVAGYAPRSFLLVCRVSRLTRAAILWQILSIIFMLELATESKKPHYMRGGVPGKIDQLPFDGIQGIWTPKIKFWDPLGFMGALTEEQKAKKRKAELKNGRLAMIGKRAPSYGHTACCCWTWRPRRAVRRSTCSHDAAMRPPVPACKSAGAHDCSRWPPVGLHRAG